MPKKLIDKIAEKHFAKRCFFCKLEDYAILDVHRIVPGEDSGKYTPQNCIVTCANCHRKIHDGQIIIDRKFYSTNGWVLHYFENGIEFYK